MMKTRWTLFLVGLIAQGTYGSLQGPKCNAGDDLSKQLPRIKSLGPEAALDSFKIHPGFKLVPIAIEPLVSDPVSACYDADGRLYVVEMRGYPYPEKTPTGFVRRLEDRDGDGRYDRSTIYVNNLSWPTGVVPFDDGVFIAVASDIYYAKDTDGDGIADFKKVMFTGFGTQNVQGLYNGLLWGPDGWIYGVSGTNGGEIKNLTKPEAKSVSVRGRDFRFKPDGSAFEAISGGGQFGHSFDDWGHRFTCMNTNQIRQIVLPSWYLERNPALIESNVVEDIAEDGPAGPVFRISAAEPWRVVRTAQRAADPVMSKKLPPNELVPIGFFTSATGVTIYRGDAFAPEYQGNAFIGDVGGNLVHRKTLTKQGALFQAHRADEKVEFLASTDNWFRPVNFANTPDGTLLILDMYRETIEHPLSIPDPIKKHLDLTSGKDLGRIYNLVPDHGYRHRNPRLSRLPNDELVRILADGSAWWRETAQRLLIERNAQSAIPALKTLVRNRPNALGRVHALWTLHVLNGLSADDLRLGLSDVEPGVREQAAKLTEGNLSQNTDLINGLLALSQDPDPMVRFQTAFSLGGLVAKDPRAIDVLATLAIRGGTDRWTRVAVLSSVSRRGHSLIAALLAKKPSFFSHADGRPWLGDLTAMIGREHDFAAVQAVLIQFSRPGSNPAILGDVVRGLGTGLKQVGSSFREVFQGPIRPELIPLFALAAEVTRSDGPIQERVEAIRLLSFGPIDQVLATIPDRLDAREPNEVQFEAIQVLNDQSDPRVGSIILSHWKGLSPAVRREAVEALFARPERLNALFDALQAKVLTSSDLDPVRHKQLLEYPEPSVRARAKKLLAASVRADRSVVIAGYRSALVLTGNREKGKKVFGTVCATCHRAEGFGADIGPNFATITSKSPEDLLIHILDPNREVAANFLNYTIETREGRILTGLIADESANSVTLKRAGGATDVIPRNRIEAIASTGLSAMPEGLEKGLEPADFADLIAYIKGIQVSR